MLDERTEVVRKIAKALSASPVAHIGKATVYGVRFRPYLKVKFTNGTVATLQLCSLKQPKNHT